MKMNFTLQQTGWVFLDEKKRSWSLSLYEMDDSINTKIVIHCDGRVIFDRLLSQMPHYPSLDILLRQRDEQNAALALSALATYLNN